MQTSQLSSPVSWGGAVAQGPQPFDTLTRGRTKPYITHHDLIIRNAARTTPLCDYAVPSIASIIIAKRAA